MKFNNHIHHRNHFNHSSDRGFSLIELVFAMMFLTIIILGVVSLQTSNLGMLSGQKNQIQAHFLATQGAQIVKALGYDEINDNIGDCLDSCYIPNEGPYDIAPISPGNITVGNQVFKRKIQAVTMNTINSYKIRSIVEWEDSTGAHYEKDPVTSVTLNSQEETDLIIIKP